jgi:uncharacterized protein YbgA (DUF1722 family)/uncharacterized protein YbbK (DUF523 family)
MQNEFRIGISSCLLGNRVRFDGGHKHDRFITDTIGKYVTFVPVCPEVECGLGVPRETLRLEGDEESYRLVFSKSGEDITDRMKAWAQARLDQLEKENLCGFIFKRKSPSSGMERVKIYGPKGQVSLKGRGIFAGMFMDRFPEIPVEEEGRLNDPVLRENFIERIFSLNRWRNLCAEKKSIGSLVEFHTCNKLLIMSHSTELYREMGKLVADAKQHDIETLFSRYSSLFISALSLRATVKKNLNVLYHIMGYFKKELTSDEKQELIEILTDYSESKIPLIVPVTMLKHYVRKYSSEYLQKQTYLSPHPLEMKLRNHV